MRKSIFESVLIWLGDSPDEARATRQEWVGSPGRWLRTPGKQIRKFVSTLLSPVKR